jgi:MFS family permease
MKQGLHENWRQFALLIIVNAFVGGMVGMERSILPQLAHEKFNIDGHYAILSFIIAFGFVKATSNYISGRYVGKISRKQMLIIGWLFGLPVPLLLIFAQSWAWIITANIFLGINQGLAWSTTVLMKIDLVGEKDRGFAMGLNEFAGYLAVSVMAFVSGWVATEFGLHPYPFYIGLFLAAGGLFLSVFAVHDTTELASTEKNRSDAHSLKKIFSETSWHHRNLGSITQAGFINNLNDALAWGVIPIWMNQRGFSLYDISLVAAVYPAFWGIGQIFTGKLADKFCKKDVLTYGMFLQALALFAFPFSNNLSVLLVLASLLGIGTALVYPTFLAGIAENTTVADRPQSLGIFRFWRDSGYVAGGLVAAMAAQWFGLSYAIGVVAMLTLFSAIILKVRMYCPTKINFTNCANPKPSVM